ncbi:hypothetical protein GE118_01380 [Mycoplasma sp. NEAQ87857]|uniref:hypothetical protein n=1 Tax=Mycoplasma sp. NEAQ87857 TaxID=2683967 RepID=UPI001317F6DE|nr:hypothetical protein [Mycoplasma sp. NEAQ87857]QGZ97446.1 hypothetical protein GE118_01380 [Mycoplasma sp. NEAQ87857]
MKSLVTFAILVFIMQLVIIVGFYKFKNAQGVNVESGFFKFYVSLTSVSLQPKLFFKNLGKLLDAAPDTSYVVSVIFAVLFFLFNLFCILTLMLILSIKTIKCLFCRNWLAFIILMVFGTLFNILAIIQYIYPAIVSFSETTTYSKDIEAIQKVIYDLFGKKGPEAMVWLLLIAELSLIIAPAAVNIKGRNNSLYIQ